MTRQNLMSIGKFSSCCRLSIKALRYYDEQELLQPAFVDPNTGYRYYDRSQARTAVTIGMLRSLDLAVSQIKALLVTGAEERRGLLERYREEVARNLAKQQQTLLAVERMIEEDHLLPYDIAMREEPDHTVASRSCVTRAKQMVDDSTQLVDELVAELRTVGRDYEDPVMCINEDPDEAERIVVQACIGITDPHPELETAEITCIPGGPVAWVIHRGSYETLGIAYHALFAWVQERGLKQRAAVREVYLNDPTEVSVADLETEVLFPIDRVA